MVSVQDSIDKMLYKERNKKEDVIIRKKIEKETNKKPKPKEGLDRSWYDYNKQSYRRKV